VESLSDIFSRDFAINLLRQKKLSEDKIIHSEAVADLALKIADEIAKSGIKIDKKIVEAGALLHDVGLSVFGERGFEEEQEHPTPEHCVIGGKIALENGFPESVAECIECHELWSREEARIVKFPEPIEKDYIPKSWEAKAVAYADMVVFAAVEEGHNLWKEQDAMIKTYHPYINKCFKNATGKNIEEDHPLIQRIDKFHKEMIRYLKPEYIPKPWRRFREHE
jgi:uncharacterized protein